MYLELKHLLLYRHFKEKMKKENDLLNTTSLSMEEICNAHSNYDLYNLEKAKKITSFLFNNSRFNFYGKYKFSFRNDILSSVEVFSSFEINVHYL